MREVEKVRVIPKYELFAGTMRAIFFFPDIPAGRGKILSLTTQGHEEVDTLHVRTCRPGTISSSEKAEVS